MNRTALLEQRRQEQVKELEKSEAIENYRKYLEATARLHDKLYGERK